MAKAPWLTIIGLGEDGVEGLVSASLVLLSDAEIVMAPPRHLALLPDLAARTIPWPVPFSDGIETLMAHRGKRVVVLASGDPFWFGAGAVLAGHLARDEWRSIPGVSVFSLAASRLGWALEKTACFGLHSRPFETLRPMLAPGQKAIVLLRDGGAPAALAGWLTGEGFGDTRMTVLEALGGPRERVQQAQAGDFALQDISHPVCVGLEVGGDGAVLPLASGRADQWFDNDGQITKRPMRALTLSALAPRPGEHLWDIGAGSGSIAIEWMLAGADLTATAIEPRAERAANVAANAARFGLGTRLTLITGTAPEALTGLARPDAVFIGGGLSDGLLSALWEAIPAGTRLVANAVTLDSEAILADWQGSKGGDLLRIELAQARPLGRKRGWAGSYPVVQWSVVR